MDATVFLPIAQPGITTFSGTVIYGISTSIHPRELDARDWPCLSQWLVVTSTRGGPAQHRRQRRPQEDTHMRPFYRLRDGDPRGLLLTQELMLTVAASQSREEVTQGFGSSTEALEQTGSGLVHGLVELALPEGRVDSVDLVV